MLTFHLNYWPVLVAAAINMFVGAAWYSSALFGKPWSRLIGRKMEDMKNEASTGYLVSTLGALVQSWVLANVVHDINITTAVDGAFFGFFLWLAFVAASTAPDTVFAGRPWRLWQINTGYFLVVLVINGALLAVWR